MANDAIAPGLRADLTRAFDILQMGPPLGAPMQPNDAGRLDMPLFEVVYWIVTKGGSIGFDHSIRAQWSEAWAELLGAWRQNQVTITGRPASGGFPEKIAGETIAGVRIVHPFGAEEPPSSTGCPYIRSFGRAADDESWENGCNDQLYRPGKILGWTHLQALSTEVDRRWPVATIDQAAQSVEPTGAIAEPPFPLATAAPVAEAVKNAEARSVEPAGAVLDERDRPVRIPVEPHTIETENPGDSPQLKLARWVALKRWPDRQIPRSNLKKICASLNTKLTDLYQKNQVPQELRGDVKESGLSREVVGRLLGRRK
jgi:hypothetical protein